MSNVHLGTIGWSYTFWKGSFYPRKTASKDFLAYYATQFNTVEVDSSFYRIPQEQAVTNWKKQAVEGFLFAFKFPRLITHIKMLKNTQTETNLFLNRVELLEEKLGPMLLQFPPNFTNTHFDDLKSYLQALPKTHRYAVEVRNESWLNQEFYNLLSANNVALAWADSKLMEQIREETADFLYIRWEGDRKKVNGLLGKIEADRKTDLKAWAEELKPHLQSKKPIFGYFGKYFSGYPPSDVTCLKSVLLE